MSANEGMENELAERIDALLPQTQCTRCGYPDCKSYAEALAQDEADINQCPPGGEQGIARLAALLDKKPKPLNPANGVEKPRQVAIIDEKWCIGCTLCIQACPVDAIAGAPKYMHTVITELCTGCDLCVAPCPVDCIAMVPAVGEDRDWTQPRADEARRRYRKRNTRLAAEREEHARRVEESRRHLAPDDRKRALIQAAMERASERLKAAQRADAGAARKENT